ncbi:MAG: S8/S53 family peptidase [Proteobacteria bacterium]|nr:S8/S53 family peptidase [Pseudomonadota bacterium]
MVRHHLQALAASFRMEPDARRSGDVSGSEPIRLTIVLKPHQPIDPLGPRPTRGEYEKRHGTRQAVMDRVMEYARGQGLTVEHANAASHSVRLSGTYAQAQSAFEPEALGRYEFGTRQLICSSGHVHVPSDLAEHVVAVLGFDQRPVAKPHFRILPRATPPTVAYDPPSVARRYGFPEDVNGMNETIGIIELGGGYDAAQMTRYFASLNLHRTGTLEAIPVDGATTGPTGDPGSADGEVQLDIEIAGSIAPAANLAVYFGGNTSRAFLDTVSAAVHDAQRSPSVISISWGGPESNWAAQDLNAMDQLFQSAATLGTTICAASGDSGASDGSQTGAPTVDFPAASPHVLGCGGTRLPAQGQETGWNDGPGAGASGGGYSAYFTRPAWQTGNGESGRGVPDVAGDADPGTGYTVSIDGQQATVGGTSAVAPLWAALIALINQSLGTKVGFVNPALYAAPSAFTDITQGNNSGYSCGPGWDPVTGLGTPKGTAVRSALKGLGSTQVA